MRAISARELAAVRSFSIRLRQKSLFPRQGKKFLQQQAFEHFLRRLRPFRQAAEQRAAVRGQILEVQDLRAGSIEGAQKAALAAAVTRGSRGT